VDGKDEDRVLAVEQRGTVRYRTLDRPDVLNALNARVFSELEAQISAVAADPGIRADVIADAGDRAFSAGADLDELTGLDAGLAHETTLAAASGDAEEGIAALREKRTPSFGEAR
jgi:enoyl-CoA hydratase/carnithine racemase